MGHDFVQDQTEVCQDQTEVFAFLGNPATHNLEGLVVRIDTHGAAVFLAGENAFKVKRAVRFPFMDFSTLEKRRRACEKELAVNKANAPDIYLDVVPISKDSMGLKFGQAATQASSQSSIVEFAVHLRRFDENQTLDRLAERGELDLDIIVKLADVVVASHARAPVSSGDNATFALQGQVEETMDALAAASDIFPAQAAARLRRQILSAFERLAPLLRIREAQGNVRRCHGDLHLRNIVMLEATPVLFDALEFDETLATCDVLYDLSFLLMDLWTRGLRRHANQLLNQYLMACDNVDRELQGLAALPLFLALRAAIRARVSYLQPRRQAEHIATANLYFDAARGFLEPSRLDLVAIGGLSGTGKTSLARALAASIGRAPGAVHLRSDVERKRLYKVGEFSSLPSEAYRPQSSTMIYERLRDMASATLAAGQSVVIDAAHRKPEERRAVSDLANRSHAHFTGFWLEATTDVLLERVAGRKHDASDANATIVQSQAQEAVGAIEWRRLDASGAIEPLADQAIAAVSR
jgi:aminoglycoside phosphotransferase family enzyme/predicted kinase